MKEEFLKLKRIVRNKLIISFVLSLIALSAGIALSILVNVYIWLIGLLLVPIIFEIVFFVRRNSFLNLKSKLIEETINNVFPNAVFNDSKMQDFNDLRILEANDLGIRYQIEATLELDIDSFHIESYSTSFLVKKLGTVKGRVIKINSKNDIRINEKIKSAFTENAWFYNIKNENDMIYICLFNPLKDKRCNYSIDPVDFKTFDDFNNRIKYEFDYYKRVISKITTL